ncbi:PASTA domain-containing protein [Thermonema rossianum]|uniref:PASTA domain-containing protein n=1 Tax=Thermonema rossianum TaxID=55505 RepID=UPI000570680F|nr:PASTA domain-containing protein [Thermonema rossianum]
MAPRFHIRIPTHKKIHLWLHAAAALLTALLLLLFFFLLVLPFYTRQGQLRSIPGVVGLSPAKGIQKLRDAGFRPVIQDTVFVAGTPLNSIVEQHPSYGQLAKPGRKIYLRVSPPSPPRIPLPELRGLSVEHGLRRLQQAGFQNIRLRYSPDTELPPNNIVSLEDKRGKQLMPHALFTITDTLVVVVSESPESQIEVPQLMGLSEEEARFVVRALGLQIGKVEYVFDQPDLPLGMVVKQNPLPHYWEEGKKHYRHVSRGSYIDLWVVGMPVPQEEATEDSFPTP